MKKLLSALVMLTLMASGVNATAQNTLYKQTVDASMQQVYPAVYEALEDARFYIVFEPNISKNLQGFAEKWGADYNQNKLSSIRSMVFCNGWYANAVSNADPDMLALCPLRIGLYEKQGKTVIVFARPTVIAEGSAAKNVLQEVEKEVIEAIKTGVLNVKKS